MVRQHLRPMAPRQQANRTRATRRLPQWLPQRLLQPHRPLRRMLLLPARRQCQLCCQQMGAPLRVSKSRCCSLLLPPTSQLLLKPQSTQAIRVCWQCSSNRHLCLHLP